VQVLEDHSPSSPVFLTRLVKRPDGAVELEVWDAARWQPAGDRVSIRAFVDGIPAEPELLVRLGGLT
jgi:hypothetical protein